MMGGFAPRRDAEEFDALLDGSGGAGSSGAHDDLLAVVASLRSLPEVPARPEYVADLRARLVAEAARRPVRVVDDATAARLTPKQRRGANERRLATVLGGFAVVAASGSMAMASQGALPGDVLYPVKRAIENAQTNLQSDDSGKASSLIAHAEQRLEEVTALTAEQDADNAGEIAATLDDFSQQTTQAAELVLDDYEAGGDADAITDLREFTAGAMADLTALGPDLPADARPALISAAQTVQQVDGRAFQACPSCGEGPVTELPQFTTQAFDGLLGAGPSATAPVGPDFRKLVQEAEAEAEQQPPPADGRSTERRPDQPVGEVEQDPDGDLGDDLGNTVDDLLGGDDSDSGSDEDPDDGKKTPAKSVGDVATGVVDGVTGLVTGLLN